MVEAGQRKSQNPPSAEELAQAEHYEAMLAAAAKDDDEDYDFEDDDLDGEDASIELLKQRRLLAEVAQQARQYPGLIDFDEIEDSDEIMRQIYQENLRYKQDRNAGLNMDSNSAHLIHLQAEALANSGIDHLQALRMLKSQQQFSGASSQKMLNPPSCLVGNLPSNVDIDMRDGMQPDIMNVYGHIQPGSLAQPINGASGQVDMTQLQGIYPGQPGVVHTQNQLGQTLLPKQQQPQQQKFTWIQWFCQLEGHEFLLPLDRFFLKDLINMVCLSELRLSKVRLSQCRALLNRPYAPTDEELQNDQFLALNSDTSDMYGLIHARYIRSPEGLALVYGKYLQGAYGYCPRAFCDKQRVVPNALSDKLRQNRVKVYCTKCEEMYIPQGTNRLDGAYFGSSLAHLFLQTYSKAIVLPPKVYFYEPNLCGFRIVGKRGSKYYEPEHSSISDTLQKKKNVEDEINRRDQKIAVRNNSSQQGSSASAQAQTTQPRNNRSRHKGKKN